MPKSRYTETQIVELLKQTDVVIRRGSYLPAVRNQPGGLLPVEVEVCWDDYAQILNDCQMNRDYHQRSPAKLDNRLLRGYLLFLDAVTQAIVE
ncbi:MAG: hypothetical protein RLZZ385_1170 [Pseudomonadota bacterium]|jgi:hypothetical protein